eukprot:c4001_g1_i1.p1 GENE.c4001_g1_i1~~c4001_g1_i1.p1  ORF type:complete len:385 (-),score=58.52 c4001_g1_i1:33-1187(-)
MIESRTFDDNADMIRKMCEVGRRNKITNPDKMRGSYGKLMWLLQDAESPMVSRSIGFSCNENIHTVMQLLQERSILAVLEDPETLDATLQIPSRCDPALAREMSNTKKAAIQSLHKKFVSDTLAEATLSRVIHSIDDYRCFLLANQAPVDRMIDFLNSYFKPDKDTPMSLAISSGKEGSCLRHSHKEHFVFVLQSLLLWREIMGEMFHLWWLADNDLLDPRNYYKLRDTGQGLNRMQACPNVGSAMQRILSRVKSRVGSWVGLSVVHLGDRDVPNALVFIDKYTQVPRILAPLVNTIDNIDDLVKTNSSIGDMINSYFGGPLKLKQEILCDFFKHAFDGSGDDGGSCIDGRLTSAWNWCSLLEKKKYYHIFLLAGFTGFDGDMN